MKNKLLIGVYAAAGLAFATACSDTFNPSADSEGRILPSIGLDRTVAAPQSKAIDRADGQAMQISQNDLKLTLTAIDGSLQRTWDSPADFDPSENFPVGAYMMEASYGESKSGGFEKPYYYGSSKFSVYENQATPVSITASLGNAMLTITYSDAMSQYFTAFSSEVNAGASQYVHDATETRALYFAPGHVDVSINVTKPTGVSGKLNVKSFEAEARHHYKLFIDVNNGEVGAAGLTVTFNSDLVEEEVTLDVSDKVLTAEPPTIAPVGFEPGTPVEAVEGVKLADVMQMVVTAHSGISSVMLTTSESLVERGWPASIDLANADAATMQKLKNFNMDLVGLEGIKSQMAMVGFNRIPEKLSYVEGGNNEVTFTVVAKDKNSKTSEPLSFTYVINPIELAVENIAPLAVDGTELSFDLTTNAPIDGMTFECKNVQGIFRAATVNSITPVQRANGTYHVSIAVPGDERKVVMRVNYGDVRYSEVHTIARSGVAVTVDENDVFATRATLKVRCGENPATMPHETTVMLSTDGTNFTEHAAKTADKDQITITGLSDNTKYFVKVNAHNGESDIVEFTTEKAEPLVDVTQNWTSETKNNMAANCKVYTAPEPWSTLNILTTSHLNSGTSYSALSSTLNETDNGKSVVLIRSVGYNVATNASGSNNPKNYSQGEFYLGTYDNGPQYGTAFTSRPSGLEFNYRYTPTNQEDRGYVEIQVLDANNTVIASNSMDLEAKPSYENISLNLSYGASVPKAAMLKITFKSTNAGDRFLNSSDIPKHTGAFGILNGYYVGSQLWIDGVKLTY